MRKRLSRVLLASALSLGLATSCGKSEKRAPEGRNEVSSPTPGVDESGEMAPVDFDTAAAADPSPAKHARSPSDAVARPYIAPAEGPPPIREGTGTEDYKDHGKNPMVDTSEDNLSTFAIDVDTASYAISRSKILGGALPPQAAVRVEEFVNYFGYDYAGPDVDSDAPFAIRMDAAPSPFTQGRHILRVGVQAKKVSNRDRKAAHLVFLVDVSGSMSDENKLPLAKRALRVLVDNLNDGDTVALVTYAGNTRVVLEPTGLDQKGKIVSALDDLTSSGSTAMSAGIDLAYQLAEKNLRADSISRVIVLSDGDANVGNTGHAEILKQISGKVAEGVTLTTVGFGMGNYKDHLMEQLANKGNGNYFYIDTISEARKVFQEQLGGTLEVVAKDVKIQVDFDKSAVRRYRLVGYENRDIADKDFRNDRVDAGEIGAGHSVTVIYEVELKEGARNIATVRLRAKKPSGETATEWATAFDASKMAATFEQAPTDLRFATAVAGAAEILRGSEHASTWRLDDVIRIATAARGENHADRAEFIELMKRARSLAPKLAEK